MSYEANVPSYASECAAGRLRADKLLNDMVSTCNPLLLSSAVRRSVETGIFSPNDVGFFLRIAESVVFEKGE